jgi:predicted Zn-dependent peptidase
MCAFHRDFYGPNNAVLSIAGDVTPAQGFALAEKYFGKIAARPTPKPTDFSEGLNTGAPPDPARQAGPGACHRRGLEAACSRQQDQAPFAVLGQLLAGGDASRLYQGLVKGRELALNVTRSTASPACGSTTAPACSPCSRSTSRRRMPTRCWPASTRRWPASSRTAWTTPR